MSRITDKSIDLKKLSYVLPEWTRMMWSSADIRNLWEPKIQRASTTWLEVEERAVELGVRESALVFVDDNAFVEKSKYYASKELILQPLSKVAKNNSYSSSGSSQAQPGESFMYRCVLTKPEHIKIWLRAWDSGDDVMIGTLLGFPPCCIEFFQKTWVEKKGVDTSWQMYQNSSDMGDHRANILLRWMGIRLVSHLPCSFNCEHTIKLAEENLQVFAMLNHSECAVDIENLLRLPIEWSAKHGIAEIKTPLFKISTRTDATSDLYVVQRDGTFYPDEAPSGNKFPYQNKQKNLITLSKSFKKGLEAISNDRSLEWKDNGFASLEKMNEYHSDLVSQIRMLIDPFTPTSFIDLGCGNGLLLERLRDVTSPRNQFIGVEVNFDVAKRAQFRNPEFLIHNTNIFDFRSERKFDIGIISINRINEQKIYRREVILQLLNSICHELIIYSYDRVVENLDIEDLNVKIVNLQVFK